MRIEHWLPDPHFRSAHARAIAAPPAAVYAALSGARFSRPWIIRLLLGLRAIPVVLTGRVRRVPPAPYPTWGAGPVAFTVLEDVAPHELVLGLQGAFWQLDGGLVPAPPDAYRTPCPPGLARVAWNFHVAPEGDGSRLSTETRITCGDEASRRRFARYWRFIAPFSGVIRGAMLREVERAVRR